MRATVESEVVRKEEEKAMECLGIPVRTGPATFAEEREKIRGKAKKTPGNPAGSHLPFFWGRGGRGGGEENQMKD